MNDSEKFSVVKYNANSYIIINGDFNNKNFYIIQDGDVRISNNIGQIIDDEDDILKKGDFFGVESSMANLPRIETVISLKPAVLIAVQREQFNILINKSPSIALKIIRSFSNKLRKYDHLIVKYSLKSLVNATSEEEALYASAQYYGNSTHPDYAFKMLQAYMKNYPTGRYYQEASKQVAALEQYRSKNEDNLVVNGLSAAAPKNFLIFTEGEIGDKLYIIQKGKVNITKILDGKEILIAVLKEGDIFGEMALLEDKPRTATAITSEPCSFLIVERQNFDSMVATQPAMAARLITILSERIWVAYRQLENSLLKEPLARLWDMLLIQLQKNRVIPEEKGVFVFPFTLQGLVKMVGLNDTELAKYRTELLNTKKFEEHENKLICKDTIILQKQVEYYQKMFLRKEKILKRE